MDKADCSKFSDAYTICEIKVKIMQVISGLENDNKVTKQDAANDLIEVVNDLTQLEAEIIGNIAKRLPQK